MLLSTVDTNFAKSLGITCVVRCTQYAQQSLRRAYCVVHCTWLGVGYACGNWSVPVITLTACSTGCRPNISNSDQVLNCTGMRHSWIDIPPLTINLTSFKLVFVLHRFAWVAYCEILYPATAHPRISCFWREKKNVCWAWRNAEFGWDYSYQ